MISLSSMFGFSSGVCSMVACAPSSSSSQWRFFMQSVLRDVISGHEFWNSLQRLSKALNAEDAFVGLGSFLQRCMSFLAVSSSSSVFKSPHRVSIATAMAMSRALSRSHNIT